MSRTPLVFAAAIALALATMWLPALADPPQPLPGSKLAPAQDLVDELDEYVETLTEDLEEVFDGEVDFADAKEGLGKYANTLVLIAVALGLHDEDNKYKAAAPGIVGAAGQLAAAEDQDAAKKALDAVQASLSSQGDPSSLSWGEKNASLPELMKAVPLVNTRLKRYIRRFERSAEDVAAHSAVLAVIAQGSIPNAGDTEKPDELEKWYEFCVQMRDSAAALNAAAHAEDEDAGKEAMDALQKSCDDCHEVFHEEEA